MAVERFDTNFGLSIFLNFLCLKSYFFAKISVFLLCLDKFWPSAGSPWPFSESKNRFMDCLRVALESLRNWFSKVFGLKSITVRHIISWKDCQDIPQTHLNSSGSPIIKVRQGFSQVAKNNRILLKLTVFVSINLRGIFTVIL